MRRDLDELYAAIESKDAGRVEHALMECYGSGMTRDHVPALIALLGQPWHYRHEDVVSEADRSLGARTTPQGHAE